MDSRILWSVGDLLTDPQSFIDVSAQLGLDDAGRDVTARIRRLPGRATWAHLPGQHDQATHQVWSRPREFADVRSRKQTLDDRRVGHRDPFPHEVKAAVDFLSMQRVWETAVRRLVSSWAPVRAAQIDDLTGQIEAAVTLGDAAAIARVSATPIGQDVIYAHMRSVASEAAELGLAEAAAQGVTRLPTVDVTALEQVLLAQSEAAAILNAQSISGSAARQGLLRYGVDNLTAEEVAQGVREHLESLSPRELEDQFGGALTMSQNTARVHVAQLVAEEADIEVYSSELLDQNTCENCAAVDGTEYDTLEDALRDYPAGGHRDCLGGPRCRGTLVIVYDESEATL